MRVTWYVLEDGSVADPSDCATDDTGALIHKSGDKVAMRSADCPMSRGVDVDERTGKLLFGGKGDHDGDGSTGGAKPKGKDMKPDAGKPGYKTREAKAD